MKAAEIETPSWMQLKIIQSPLHPNNYYQEAVEKKQIYIHHLAGEKWQSAKAFWESRRGGHGTIATAFIVSRKGEVVQLFDERFWAWHLSGSDFVKLSGAISPEKLNKQSIGIELEAWGWLQKVGEQFYSWTGKEIDPTEVTKLDQPHRGHQYYDIYTDAQIETTTILVNALCDKHNIPKEYHDPFQISEAALMGKKMIAGHCNVSTHKSDPYPDPRLIASLKSLSNTKKMDDHIPII